MFLPAAGDAAAARPPRPARRAWPPRPPLARVLAFSEAEESSSARDGRGGRRGAGRGRLTRPGPGRGGHEHLLQRAEPAPDPAGPADGLAWSVNPQIHAFDDLSLMENLQAQPDTIATARSFAPGTGLLRHADHAAPAVQRGRGHRQEFRPTASCPGRSTSGSRRCSAPPGRSAASRRSAARGADGLTYYDTVGPAGVIESPAGSPARPSSSPGRTRRTRSRSCWRTRSAGGRAGVPQPGRADPARVAAIAVGQPDRTTVLLANLTAADCEVPSTLTGLAAPGRGPLRILDEHSAERGRRRPAAFLRSWPEVTSTEGQ